MSTLREIRRALGIATQIISAAEPLTELGKLQKAEVDSRAACQVCLDSHLVGAPGHQIDCPSCCNAESQIQFKCRVCEDTKKVGSASNQIRCPACK